MDKRVLEKIQIHAKCEKMLDENRLKEEMKCRCWSYSVRCVKCALNSEDLFGRMSEIVRNDDGCPCLATCCNKTDIFTPSHDCVGFEGDEFCEECYVSACYSCASTCHCDL